MATTLLFDLGNRSNYLLSVLFLLLYSFCTLSFAGSYATNKAIEYYKNGEYSRAKSILSGTDITNDPTATYMMGAISLVEDEFGQTSKNIDNAIYWFEISANLNNPQAYHALGRTYEQRWLNNRNLDDYEKSKINYELAINNDIGLASSDLSRLVSGSKSNLNEVDEQRLVAINNRTYLIAKSTQPVESNSEPEDPTTDNPAVVAPSDTGSQRKTHSKKWEMQPFIGFTANNFTINGSDFTGTDLNTNISIAVPGTSSDKGSAPGLTGGVFINENKKMGFSYFSGEEEDSSIMTVTVTSVYIDHSFNNSGIHQGWFLGGGVSSVEIEVDQTSLTAAATEDASGLMVRGGYEHMFDSQLYLEVGLNLHLVELDQKIRGTGANSNIEIGSTMDVFNIHLSLSYVF